MSDTCSFLHLYFFPMLVAPSICCSCIYVPVYYGSMLSSVLLPSAVIMSDALKRVIVLQQHRITCRVQDGSFWMYLSWFSNVATSFAHCIIYFEWAWAHPCNVLLEKCIISCCWNDWKWFVDDPHSETK
jgi:hypothetical protein